MSFLWNHAFLEHKNLEPWSFGAQSWRCWQMLTVTGFPQVFPWCSQAKLWRFSTGTWRTPSHFLRCRLLSCSSNYAITSTDWFLIIFGNRMQSVFQVCLPMESKFLRQNWQLQSIVVHGLSTQTLAAYARSNQSVWRKILTNLTTSLRHHWTDG